jgi:hypothetical protein
MKKRMTIVALFIVSALVGIWFATRRPPGVSITEPPPSSLHEVRPTPESPAPDSQPNGKREPAVPERGNPPVDERERGQSSPSRPNVEAHTREEESRPDVLTAPPRPPITIEPEPLREATATPPVPPARVPEPTSPEASQVPDTLNPELSTASASRPTVSSRMELASVQQLLEHYQQMYDQLDASMAASIWPAMDARALARVFARLQRQDLNFDGCAVALSEAHATAQCTGWLSYVTRVGNGTPHREHHSWTIEFERTGSEWHILQVGAR